jgi:DNA invertase Pin-like site-specific DNA recombinase
MRPGLSPPTGSSPATGGEAMGAATIAYTRRSTEKQDTSHEAQLTAIRAARTDARLFHVQDTCSGSTPFEDREGGAYVLKLLGTGEAETLVVSKLDRACRSVLDGADLIRRAEAERWSFVCLDLGLDTSTPMGRAMAHVALAFAELERERIRERVTEGLAVAKSRGRRLGAPPVDADLARRIVRERRAGMTLASIARGLQEDGIPTTRGGQRWYPSTIRSVLVRAGEGT